MDTYTSGTDLRPTFRTMFGVPDNVSFPFQMGVVNVPDSFSFLPSVYGVRHTLRRGVSDRVWPVDDGCP